MTTGEGKGRNEGDSANEVPPTEDALPDAWILSWRPEWGQTWVMALRWMGLVWLVSLVFADHAVSELTPLQLFVIPVVLTGIAITDLLEFLNLKSPMRIEVLSRGRPTELRIYTRSLRGSILEDRDLIRFSRSRDEVLLFFRIGKRNRSFWFRLVFSSGVRANRLHIRRHQFDSEEAWRSFLSLLEDYPKKQE